MCHRALLIYSPQLYCNRLCKRLRPVHVDLVKRLAKDEAANVVVGEEVHWEADLELRRVTQGLQLFFSQREIQYAEVVLDLRQCACAEYGDDVARLLADE